MDDLRDKHAEATCSEGPSSAHAQAKRRFGEGHGAPISMAHLSCVKADSFGTTAGANELELNLVAGHVENPVLCLSSVLRTKFT